MRKEDYMNNKKSKNSKGGLYIAVCCFAVLAAAIGYAGRSNNSSSPSKQNDISVTDKTSNNTYPSDKITQAPVSKVEMSVEDYVPENVPTNEQNTSSAKNEEIAVSKTADAYDVKFKMPVDGKVSCAFSGDELIYNKFLSDWRSHNGVDISCDKNSAVYSSADGIVTEILDNSMGKSVTVEHNNGYLSVYSNLSEEIAVKAGDEVRSGSLIGKISDSNPSDFTKDYHLHFEIIHNDKYVDPMELIE